MKLHPPSPFIITQPGSCYSFYHPTKGGRLVLTICDILNYFCTPSFHFFVYRYCNFFQTGYIISEYIYAFPGIMSWSLLQNDKHWYLWTSRGIGWPKAYPAMSSTTSIYDTKMPHKRSKYTNAVLLLLLLLLNQDYCSGTESKDCRNT